LSLADVFTGGKDSEASDRLAEALRAIQAVKTPTADEMKYKVEQLVQAGVLTPEQAKAYLQSPNAMLGQNIDQTGTGAQETAIADLLGAASEGGLNPAEQAKMGDITQQLNTQEKGANDAVVQRQAERGALTGGETMAAQLANNQAGTVNANQLGRGTAADAYNAMLQELTSAGSMGGTLQGQQNTQANTVGAATNAINQFNAAQQQGVENQNVANENTARAFNLENEQNIGNTNVGNANAYSQYQAQLPQEVFQDDLQKAGAEAGVNTQQANQAMAEGKQNAAAISSVANFVTPFIPAAGAAGQVASGVQGTGSADNNNPTTYAEGGEVESYLNGGQVNGRARVPGNSPKNDTVPAVLSPGEVVLPRTVAHSSPDKVLDFLNRIRAKKEGPTQIHPEDSAHLLQALTLARHKI